MTKIDRVIKKLSELYEFNRKIKAYELRKKEMANTYKASRCQEKKNPLTKK